MSYLPYKRGLYRGWHLAKGQGIHADEADSALSDIAGKLSRGTTLSLAGEASTGAMGVRQNPETVVVQQRELFPIAMAVTGMWGKEPIPADRRREVTIRRQLPVVRNNPSGSHYPARDYRPFFERMEHCLALIEQLRARAETRYLSKGASNNRPWVNELDKMTRAVRFVLDQRGKASPSIFVKQGDALEPFGMRWGVVAGKGNKKLPFAAYSELPMATCAGAGACAVQLNPDAPRGYCYSFKAFRYPAAFARQFLNTLANYADRYFASVRSLKKSKTEPSGSDYKAWVELSVQGSERGYRLWPQFVKNLVLEVTEPARAAGRTSFLRLFVDGDINTEDNILEWMQVCHDIGPKGADTRVGGHIEVYGYSKCWARFVNVDKAMRTEAERSKKTLGQWPSNYTLNLSTDSIYAAPTMIEIRKTIEELPVTRWYFQGIPLKEHLKELETICANSPDCASIPIKLPPASEMPFTFSEDRIRMFVQINDVRTPEQAEKLFPSIRWPNNERPKQNIEQASRAAAYRAFFAQILADPTFIATVRKEMLKDKASGGEKMGSEPGKAIDEDRYLDTLEKKQMDRLEKLVTAKRAGQDVSKQEAKLSKYFDALSRGETIRPLVEQDAFSKKALHDKALAMVLHETFWTLGIGGSCPLVCGNCSDNFADPSKGVHRCASKTSFRGKTVHIGIH